MTFCGGFVVCCVCLPGKGGGVQVDRVQKELTSQIVIEIAQIQIAQDSSIMDDL